MRPRLHRLRIDLAFAAWWTAPVLAASPSVPEVVPDELKSEMTKLILGDYELHRQSREKQPLPATPAEQEKVTKMPAVIVTAKPSTSIPVAPALKVDDPLTAFLKTGTLFNGGNFHVKTEFKETDRTPGQILRPVPRVQLSIGWSW
jgi:hypothetical protein